MQALTEHEQANQAFSTALSLWPNLADGWLSWGAHCDAMYQQSGNPTWLQYAVTCYLQVIRPTKHASSDCTLTVMAPCILIHKVLQSVPQHWGWRPRSRHR